MEKLRQYYRLVFDSNREDLQSVEDYDMGDFDLRKLWTGERYEGGIPSSVRINLSEGAPSDYLGNPMSWMIISKKLADLLEPFIDKHVQYIPINLLSTDGRAVHDYLLGNPLGLIDAILTNKKNKEKVTLSELVLDSSKIPSDRHVFRLLHKPTNIILSDEAFNALQNQGLNGVAVLKIPTK